MTRVDVIWEFELEGSPEFARSFVRNNISRVTESALAGGVLPQKSTDFYPKLLSGETIFRIEGLIEEPK